MGVGCNLVSTMHKCACAGTLVMVTPTKGLPTTMSQVSASVQVLVMVLLQLDARRTSALPHEAFFPLSLG